MDAAVGYQAGTANRQVFVYASRRRRSWLLQLAEAVIEMVTAAHGASASAGDMHGNRQAFCLDALQSRVRSCHQQLVAAAWLSPVPYLHLLTCCACCCCCWLQEKKAAEEARKKELAELFAATIKQPKVPAGAQQGGARCGAARL
jgi:hypothetical protein